MFWRKLLFVVLCMIGLLLFGEFLALQAIGLGAKIYCYWGQGISLEYRALLWGKEGFVCKDFIAQKPGQFCCQTPDLVVSFGKRQIQLHSPHVTLEQFSPDAQSGPMRWTIAIQEGTLDTDAAKGVAFAGDYNGVTKEGTFLFSKQDAEMTVQTSADGIDIECRHVPLELFDSSYTGTLYGSLHVLPKENGWVIRTGFFDLEHVKIDEWLEGVCGTVHWDGCLFFDGQTFDWTRFRDEGRLRIFVSQGDIKGSLQKIQGVQGSLSFDGKSGAKWQFFGSSSHEKIEGSGKGFFHSLKECWVESELCIGKTNVSIRGNELGSQFIWEIDAENITPHSCAYFQDAAFLCDFIQTPWYMEKGLLQVSLQCSLCDGKVASWKIHKAHIEDIHLLSEQGHFACNTFVLNDGLYQFEGATWIQNGHIYGRNFKGQGSMKNACLFSGDLSGNIGDLSVVGHVDSYGVSIKANVQLEGTCSGTLFVSAEFLEEGLSFQMYESSLSIAAMHVESLRSQGRIDASGISIFEMKGTLNAPIFAKKIPFYCPVLQSEGRFDIRLQQPTFDLARWTGSIREGLATLDSAKSHILGNSCNAGNCLVSHEGIEKFLFLGTIPGAFFTEIFTIPSLVFEEDLSVSIAYASLEGGKIDLKTSVSYLDKKLPCALLATVQGTQLTLDSFRIDQGMIEGLWELRADGLHCVQGKGFWEEQLLLEFTGHVASWNAWDVHLHSIVFDLHSFLPISGSIQGKGLLSYKGSFEADFDITASPLIFGQWSLNNSGPLHVLYSSKGVFVRGIHVEVVHPQLVFGPIDLRTDLFHYDLEHGMYYCSAAQMYLPSGWQQLVPAQLDPCTVQLCGDFSIAYDLSEVEGSVRELVIGLGGATERIQNGHIALAGKVCHLDFELAHHNTTIPLEVTLQVPSNFWQLKSMPSIIGRCIVDHGLSVDWTYDRQLKLCAIEGECRGLKASFCLDDQCLIGSAEINGHELQLLVPEKIAKVFTELKIGDGYELMGKVACTTQGLVFDGILRGKEIELFGFQLRSILGNISWDKDHLEILNLRVNDLAGRLKVDRIWAGGPPGDDPWKLLIPQITVKELRPSLLRVPGKPLGKLTPLVIRDLQLTDFQGIVDQSSTYTAQGELYFINSYKRGKSIFELPSDLFSRILGLDLDLLVPVCGTLRYHIKDGFVHLTDLSGAYSENQRSEFFLVYNEDSPKMDLDWNLQILIQMKQFVLFKFTEAFIISVTGQLDEPKFQLHRKNTIFSR